MSSQDLSSGSRSLPDILTLPELAEFLRVSKNTVYRMVETREIPFHKIRRTLRFRRRDVESYILKNRTDSKTNWN